MRSVKNADGVKKADSVKKSYGNGGCHVNSPRHKSPCISDLQEDAHIHIGGVLVLRFYPSSGDIQMPVHSERRRALRNYLSRFLMELEAYK